MLLQVAKLELVLGCPPKSICDNSNVDDIICFRSNKYQPPSLKFTFDVVTVGHMFVLRLKTRLADFIVITEKTWFLWWLTLADSEVQPPTL